MASTPRERLVIEIVQASDVKPAIDLEWVRAALEEALPLVASWSSRPIGQVAVRIVDDERMIQLNQRFAHHDGTTDVLSFDLACDVLSGTEDHAISADIAICADVAARRAAELGHSIERELLLYGIHGLLHCAGFDDRSDSDYVRMHAEEDRILNMIGVGVTFDRGASEGGPDRRGGAPL